LPHAADTADVTKLADIASARAWPVAACSRGFTLIELLIVLVIIAVLLAIAVPSYVGMRNRASDATAKQNIRAAATAAEAYANENTGQPGDADNNASTSGYRGMTTARLRNYDRGIRTALTVLASRTTTTAYCVRITINGRTWSALGPGLTTASYRNNANCI
jgi:prepilin-type N-terminal cleavage/methylation domain-containing protein